MKKQKQLIATLLITTSLFSCASSSQHAQKEKPKPHIEFTTSLKPDGVKNFIYTETLPTREKSGGRKSGGGRGGPGGKGPGGGRDGKGPPPKQRSSSGGKNEPGNHMNFEERKKIFYEALDEHLLVTAYCQDGYVERRFRTKGTAMQVTGDCIEKASDEDIRIFFTE